MKKKLPKFDKYDLYFRSVQDPPQTARFIERIYRQRFGRAAASFGEDFCGTFAMSCEWARRNPHANVVAVDLDPEPLNYGRKHYFSTLLPEQQKRVQILRGDVLKSKLPKVDLIAAMNFSFFIFKQREVLKHYFERTYARLHSKGLFVLDCFGGDETLDPNEDVADYGTHKYYWDQVSFDPITHEAGFYIHFKRPGEKRRERVFRYDWRMWTLPELRDLLVEVGFKNVDVYWEGDAPSSKDESVFHKKRHEENAPAWLAYIVGEKR